MSFVFDNDKSCANSLENLKSLALSTNHELQLLHSKHIFSHFSTNQLEFLLEEIENGKFDEARVKLAKRVKWHMLNSYRMNKSDDLMESVAADEDIPPSYYTVEKRSNRIVDRSENQEKLNSILFKPGNSNTILKDEISNNRRKTDICPFYEENDSRTFREKKKVKIKETRHNIVHKRGKEKHLKNKKAKSILDSFSIAYSPHHTLEKVVNPNVNILPINKSVQSSINILPHTMYKHSTEEEGISRLVETSRKCPPLLQNVHNSSIQIFPLSEQRQPSIILSPSKIYDDIPTNQGLFTFEHSQLHETEEHSPIKVLKHAAFTSVKEKASQSQLLSHRDGNINAGNQMAETKNWPSNIELDQNGFGIDQSNVNYGETRMDFQNNEFDTKRFIDRLEERLSTILVSLPNIQFLEKSSCPSLINSNYEKKESSLREKSSPQIHPPPTHSTSIVREQSKNEKLGLKREDFNNKRVDHVIAGKSGLSFSNNNNGESCTSHAENRVSRTQASENLDSEEIMKEQYWYDDDSFHSEEAEEKEEEQEEEREKEEVQEEEREKEEVQEEREKEEVQEEEREKEEVQEEEREKEEVQEEEREKEEVQEEEREKEEVQEEEREKEEVQEEEREKEEVQEEEREKEEVQEEEREKEEQQEEEEVEERSKKVIIVEKEILAKYIKMTKARESSSTSVHSEVNQNKVIYVHDEENLTLGPSSTPGNTLQKLDNETNSLDSLNESASPFPIQEELGEHIEESSETSVVVVVNEDLQRERSSTSELSGKALETHDSHNDLTTSHDLREDPLNSWSSIIPESEKKYLSRSLEEKELNRKRDALNDDPVSKLEKLSSSQSLNNYSIINASGSVSAGETILPSIEIGDVTISEGEIEFEASISDIQPCNQIAIKFSTKDFGFMHESPLQSVSSSLVEQPHPCSSRPHLVSRETQTTNDDEDYEIVSDLSFSEGVLLPRSHKEGALRSSVTRASEDITNNLNFSEGEVLENGSPRLSPSPEELTLLEKENKILMRRLSSFTGCFCLASNQEKH